MSDILSVINAYLHSDEHFEQLGEDDCERGGDVMAEVWENLRTVNAAAYFVLLFSQLEARINGLCREVIVRNQEAPHSAERRAWDILDPDPARIRSIRFMSRVALLTDRGGTVYKRVKELYDTRNKIAHGGPLTEPLDMAEIARDIERIAVQLKGVT